MMEAIQPEGLVVQALDSVIVLYAFDKTVSS